MVIVVDMARDRVVFYRNKVEHKYILTRASANRLVKIMDKMVRNGSVEVNCLLGVYFFDVKQ